MPAEPKRVLGVEHEQVQLELHHEVDDLFERVEHRYFPTGDVDEQTAFVEVRRIVDVTRGNGLARKLRKRLDAVTKPRRPAPGESDLVRAHTNPVPLATIAAPPKLDTRPEILRARMRLDS